MTSPLKPVAISPLADIVADMKAGRMVILVDEEDAFFLSFINNSIPLPKFADLNPEFDPISISSGSIGSYDCIRCFNFKSYELLINIIFN